MPIRPENLALYPADWKQIRARILERDGNRCKFCGVPNHETIFRCVIGGTPAWGDPARSGTFYSAIDGSIVYDGFAIGEDEGRHVKIVLTIAHLHDPNPANCADDNLAALCQRCHNILDMPMRKANAAARRRGALAAGDLFTPPR